jgi:hypothetical protein
VRLDAALQLVIDGVLEVLEGGFDLGELDVELPQLSRLASAQIGAQQVAPFASPRLAQLLRSSVYLKLEPRGTTSTSTKRHAARALARAAPSFISSSSRVSFMACSYLSRAHSHFNWRRRIALSLAMRAWLA